jgi:hypothetical protein
MLNPIFANEDLFYKKDCSSHLTTDFIGIFNQLIHWAIGRRVPDMLLFSRTLEAETGHDGRI